MTRRLDLSRPVRCARCGAKFTRAHGREKLCMACRPNRDKARSAARQGQKDSAEGSGRTGDLYPTKPAGEAPLGRQLCYGLARELARDVDALTLQEFLTSPCPHGQPVADCPEPWCRNRIADLQVTEYKRGGQLVRFSHRYNARPVPHWSVIDHEQAPEVS